VPNAQRSSASGMQWKISPSASVRLVEVIVEKRMQIVNKCQHVRGCICEREVLIFIKGTASCIIAHFGCTFLY